MIGAYAYSANCQYTTTSGASPTSTPDAWILFTKESYMVATPHPAFDRSHLIVRSRARRRAPGVHPGGEAPALIMGASSMQGLNGIQKLNEQRFSSVTSW